MRRLTSSEIELWKERLSKWQTPEEMQSAIAEVMSITGSSYLFRQGGLAFIRDGWIAGKFSTAIGAEMVRLVSDEWPDFETKTPNKKEEIQFEAVEADQPGRRRGDEYKEIADRQEVGDNIVENDPFEDWIARAEQAPDMLREAARRKVEKRYAKKCDLVIYLNLGEYGVRQREIEDCMPDATMLAKDRFEHVWVLWKDRAYKTWEKGVAVFLNDQKGIAPG